MKQDRENILSAIKKNGFWLKFESEVVRSDREMTLAAVQQDGWALEFATKAFQADKEIVMTAVCKDGWALQVLNLPTLAGGVGVEFFQVGPFTPDTQRAFQFASDELRADVDVVLAAVHEEGYALQ